MAPPRRAHLKDYVMNESSSNSSSRCLGLLLTLFILSFSNALFCKSFQKKSLLVHVFEA